MRYVVPPPQHRRSGQHHGIARQDRCPAVPITARVGHGERDGNAETCCVAGAGLAAGGLQQYDSAHLYFVSAGCA